MYIRCMLSMDIWYENLVEVMLEVVGKVRACGWGLKFSRAVLILQTSEILYKWNIQ